MLEAAGGYWNPEREAECVSYWLGTVDRLNTLLGRAAMQRSTVGSLSSYLLIF